jgi:hypothetical protein
VPAVARTTTGYELFGFVSFTEGERGGPTDFAAQADFTSETAEANPDWKLDLNDDVVGSWRGEKGNIADMTLVWGVPLMAGGQIVTAELADLTVDQCAVVEERFTLLAPDNYRSDYLDIKLWDGRGNELASESLYVDDDEEDDEDEDAAGQDAAGQDAAGEDAAGQDAAGQDAAGQDAAGQDAAGQDAAPGSAAPGGPGPA